MGESNCPENSGGVKTDAGSSPAPSSIREEYAAQMEAALKSPWFRKWSSEKDKQVWNAYQVHDKPTRNWSDYI